MSKTPNEPAPPSTPAEPPAPQGDGAGPQAGREKPNVVKVKGFTIIDNMVIPKKNDSRPPGHFRSLSEALLRSKDFTAAQKLILAVLQDMLGQNDRAWPSVATLARETGHARSTVAEAVRQMEERRILVIDEGGGRKRSNRHYVTQLAFPCKLAPEVLCDRTSCPGECDWSESGVQVALTAGDEPKPPENGRKTEDVNSPDSGEFIEETPRDPESLAPETHRNPGRNQVTINTQPRNRGAKEPSAASGDGGDAPAPSSAPDSSTSKQGGSIRQEFKKWFCQRYETAFGKSYRWQAKDGAIVKEIFGDGYDLDQVKAATEAMFKDPWALEGPKVSMGVFSSKFNQYLPGTGQGGLQALPPDAGYAWDRKAIDVHTLPVEGEEPAVWPWPRRYTVRQDSDIPAGKEDWLMSEFSAEIIRQAEEWLRTSGCWALTMFGPPGNGKSTVAAALLQSYRDEMFPHDDDRGKSAFVSFEEFERCAVLESERKSSGWKDNPEINQEFLSYLTGKTMLVLDDLGNRAMSKLHVSALQNLLMLREGGGAHNRKTIITTNRTVAEIGRILSPSVADRIAGGVILRFVDGSLRGDTNAPRPGIPAPEGEDLIKAATATLKAMEQYIQYGPGAFARPRSFEKVPTAFDLNGRDNETVESIAGAYLYRLCMSRNASGQPLCMPAWEHLFKAVRTLADHVGGVGNASRYMNLLTVTYWKPACDAVRQHAHTSGEAPPADEVIFLSPPVWQVMQEVVQKMTKPT